MGDGGITSGGSSVGGSQSKEIGARGVSYVVEECEFYCVWTKTGHIPQFVHSTVNSANHEAARLARENPGQKFILMRAYRKVRAPLPDGASSQPDIMDGQACVVGTRIPIRAIKRFRQAGYTTAQIVREYPTLTAAQIEGLYPWIASLEPAAAAPGTAEHDTTTERSDAHPPATERSEG